MMTATPNNLQVARVKPEQSKVAKQNVPAFLNKLATMVSDPETDDLIRWSDDGESFYVPNHERFGKELLPKFFKHGNFSSFVRQLNMYGFHKVPHLQQGVLKNETENELWQFSNPNFKRNFPDLLPLIARKKGTLNLEERDEEGNVIPGTGANLRAPTGALDLRTIANGISSIRRHQNAISNELKELQNSNSALWQEALAARERHQAHQETINKILRFLAGVFGPNAGMGMSGSPTSPSVSGVREHKDETGGVITRKKPLMLEGRKPGTKTKGKRKAPSDEDDEYISPVSPEAASAFISPSTTDAHRFTEVASEAGATPASEITNDRTPQTNAVPLPNVKRNPSDAFTPSLMSRSRTPIAGPGNTNQTDPNNVFNSTLQALLNSPNSAHRLLASLASMPQGTGLPPGMTVPPNPDPSQQAQLQQFVPYQPPTPGVAPYQFPYPNPNFDFNSIAPVPPYNAPVPGYGTAPLPPVPAPIPPNTLYQPTPADAQHAQMLQSVAQNNAGLQRAYKDTEAINADVDALQDSINSLINSLGIDPNAIQVPGQEGQENGDHAGDVEEEVVPPGDGTVPPDFDIEAFLNSLNAADPNAAVGPDGLVNGTGLSGPHYDAFLDEVSSQGTASPKSWAGDTLGTVEIPPLPTTNLAAQQPPPKKRKSVK